jgi:hypothetical protein
MGNSREFPSRGWWSVADLFETVVAGNRLKSLEALRDMLAATVQSADAPYVAALSKQLADVLREIDALNPPKQVSTIDDLAARRAERRKKAASSKRASRKRDVGGPGGS